jgi:hypothetical protein
MKISAKLTHPTFVGMFFIEFVPSLTKTVKKYCKIHFTLFSKIWFSLTLFLETQIPKAWLEIFCIEFHQNQSRDMESTDINSLHPSELCDNYSAYFPETNPFTTLFVKTSQTSSQKPDKFFNQRQKKGKTKGGNFIMVSIQGIFLIVKSPNIRSCFCENM